MQMQRERDSQVAAQLRAAMTEAATGVTGAKPGDQRMARWGGGGRAAAGAGLGVTLVW